MRLKLFKQKVIKTVTSSKLSTLNDIFRCNIAQYIAIDFHIILSMLKCISAVFTDYFYHHR